MTGTCLFFQEYLDRRKMTEFGSMALIDEGGGGDEGVAIPLPGVKRGMALLSCFYFYVHQNL